MSPNRVFSWILYPFLKELSLLAAQVVILDRSARFTARALAKRVIRVYSTDGMVSV